MTFSNLTRKVDTSTSIDLSIEVGQIKAQYNPDKFKFWKSLHKGPIREVLNMSYSPHYRFLRQYIEQSVVIEKSPYYKLQKLYGRNDKWIRNKINKFINVFSSIRDSGYNNKIAVLSRPLVKNKYNNGFEIYEGHHRLACCLVLDMKEVPCIVLEGSSENN